ncbi:pre-mRNA-splicing factor PRP46-like [Lytechinus variegatus]|uniref:pre-mRNA-splicing factor PRP46-like n=1 Tax=Lytechinus variegatus TaxID=7654 RepID=UPI001BB22E5A|nr:pre-mRNA-splicing factor PRP46-like [Lytechinus variegatus]
MDEVEENTNIVTEIRKLRKKLRQIENLERLDRPLNHEENLKVAKKGAVRSLLQEKVKLVQEVISTTPETSTSTPDSETNPPIPKNSPDPIPEEDAEGGGETKMKRSGDHLESADSEAVDGRQDESISPEKMKRVMDDGKVVTSKGGGDTKTTTIQVSGAGQSKKASQKSPAKGQSALENKREKWSRMVFSVQDVDGHNDLITSVDCKDNVILSGSRDTTVKAWNTRTGDERCSLGGHSGAVTSVHLLTSEQNQALASHYNFEANTTCHLALSSSKDCSVRLWDLDSSKELRSIYTFNPVTAMAFLNDISCVVTGSDGGKVEMWDVINGDNLFSSLAHEDHVTCIKVRGQRVVTASSDGVIKLWELRDRSLHVIFESENIHSQSGTLVQRPIMSLGLSDTDIYYGDEGTNIKILDWKRGSVRKLRNHVGEFGSTYSMLLTDDITMFSSYDLDNGVGAINVFSAPDNHYLATLCDPETSQIESISCLDQSNPSMCFVTAGQELRIWRALPINHRSSAGAISVTFDPALTIPADDSDDESSESELSGDDVINRGSTRGSNRRSRRRGSIDSEHQDSSSWLSWCSLI